MKLSIFLMTLKMISKISIRRSSVFRQNSSIQPDFNGISRSTKRHKKNLQTKAV